MKIEITFTNPPLGDRGKIEITFTNSPINLFLQNAGRLVVQNLKPKI